MDLASSTAVVTGANRGLGRAISLDLLRRGATVHTAARRPERLDTELLALGAKPLELNITEPSSVQRAAASVGTIDVLINNAGSATGADLLAGDLDAVRLEMETHYFGTLAVTRAFAPSLIERGGSVANVLSVLSWRAFPNIGAYCAAKSAEWSLTNALRLQLAEHGVTVTALHVGFMDTDMTAGIAAPKASPADVARVLLDGVAAEAAEVVYDDVSRSTLAALSGGVEALYPQLTASR